MKRRLPAAFYNATTLFGATLALVMLILILTMFVIDAMSGSTNSYIGLITYIALPAVMLFGLFVALIGAMRTAKRMRKGDEAPKFPVVDLNQPRHRFLATSFGIGGLVLVTLSAFGSYQAYGYTESVQFCGTTCHGVMKPEYTAYQNSPHARVSCAGCHIGAGATWYVKSKFSGAYQVYSTLFNKYDRPIKTPIHNLRPAAETCEQCHWPKHFYSRKLENHTYYLSDEENSRHDISLLVKIGGTQAGGSEGIHAHMYLDNKITYVSTDRLRQDIPYVEMRTPDGKTVVYRDKESKVTDADLKKGERRVIDCIDCHNRPTHIFHPPEQTVNHALEQGVISVKLPEIKSTAVELLEKPYKTEPEALAGIDKGVKEFYQKNYPKNAASDGQTIQSAITQIQKIYSQNYFPEMGVSWKVSPNNLDHIHSKGCFRCHDDKHVSDTGRVISRNCQTCHTILSQNGPGEKPTVSMTGQEFRHPVDIGDMWKTTACNDPDCHGQKPSEK